LPEIPDAEATTTLVEARAPKEKHERPKGANQARAMRAFAREQQRLFEIADARARAHLREIARARS